MQPAVCAIRSVLRGLVQVVQIVKAMHGSNVPSSPPCEQACCSSYLTNARANGKNMWPEFRMHHTFMDGRLRCKLPSRESLAHRVFHRSKVTFVTWLERPFDRDPIIIWFSCYRKRGCEGRSTFKSCKGVCARQGLACNHLLDLQLPYESALKQRLRANVPTCIPSPRLHW